MKTIWAFLKVKENLLAIVACSVLVGYIGFLLVANYQAQNEIQDSALSQFRQETEKLATDLGNFYEDRKRDLSLMADSEALTLYFENKAL